MTSVRKGTETVTHFLPLWRSHDASDMVQVFRFKKWKQLAFAVSRCRFSQVEVRSNCYSNGRSSTQFTSDACSASVLATPCAANCAVLTQNTINIIYSDLHNRLQQIMKTWVSKSVPVPQ
jgi:hypothetical protein